MTSKPPTWQINAIPVDWGYPDLEFDLYRADGIAALVHDINRAGALYFALCHTWYRLSPNGIWQCTNRHAGAIVANLRGAGESYLYFYGQYAPSNPTDVDHKAVTEFVAGLGWKTIPLEVFDKIEASVKNTLNVWEARPEGVASDELTMQPPQNGMDSTRAGGLIRRIHALARTGRINEAEWHAVNKALISV